MSKGCLKGFPRDRGRVLELLIGGEFLSYPSLIGQLKKRYPRDMYSFSVFGSCVKIIINVLHTRIGFILWVGHAVFDEVVVVVVVVNVVVAVAVAVIALFYIWYIFPAAAALLTKRILMSFCSKRKATSLQVTLQAPIQHDRGNSLSA